MIEVVGISKRFGTVPALNGLSFTVPEGKIFGLIGPNGAGKTTTIRILSALVRPDAGTVFLNGVGLESPTQIRRMIGALIEQPGLYTRLTVCEFLHFFARLYDLPARSAHARIEELLELLEIEEFQDERLAGFSMGMKQKISLARILLHDPPILLLDEPTAGLDPLITKKVREHIFNQGGERKKTVLVSTHNLDEAVRVCDEIAVIHHGTILEQGTWETFRQKHLESGLVTITLNPLQGHYAEIVANLPGVSHVTVDMATGMLTYHTWDAHITNPKVIASLVSAGAAIVSVTQKETRLEEAYLKLVGEDTAQNGHRRQGSAEK